HWLYCEQSGDPFRAALSPRSQSAPQLCAAVAAECAARRRYFVRRIVAHAPGGHVESTSVLVRPTLVDQARERARTDPGRIGYTFVDYQADPRGHAVSLTWAEVDERARAVAAAVRDRVLAGERAAVLAPQGLDYVVAMLGAFYARVVAIPLFTPDLPGHGDRLAHIMADADPACVLTTENAAASVESLLRERPARPRDTLIVDTIPAELAGGWQDEEPRPADLAYLQYTSGSTRAPAGVMITHGCLAANAAQ